MATDRARPKNIDVYGFRTMDSSTVVNGFRIFVINTMSSIFVMFSDSRSADESQKCVEVKEGSCGLFIFPAQSNFSGRKYNLDVVTKIKSRSLPCTRSCQQWFVMVDAASLVATSHLDLSESDIDFIPVSFYKLFGYPTGIGELIS